MRKVIPAGVMDYQNVNRDIAVQYMVKKGERQNAVRESHEMRTSMAQEKREEIESTLRKKLGE